MRKEEVLEVELVEEARVGCEQGALGTGRVVHQTVGNEAGRASLLTLDHAVGEGDGTLFGEVVPAVDPGRCQLPHKPARHRAACPLARTPRQPRRG